MWWSNKKFPSDPSLHPEPYVWTCMKGIVLVQNIICEHQDAENQPSGGDCQPFQCSRGRCSDKLESTDSIWMLEFTSHQVHLLSSLSTSLSLSHTILAIAYSISAQYVCIFSPAVSELLKYTYTCSRCLPDICLSHFTWSKDKLEAECFFPMLTVQFP